MTLRYSLKRRHSGRMKGQEIRFPNAFEQVSVCDPSAGPSTDAVLVQTERNPWLCDKLVLNILGLVLHFMTQFMMG
ncbi:hypothetical protein RRG08_059210 [Elysia crispata]|uniref:Uncharacterized protein n=1 Tax=Elysia crispata TaxID=231223 RepID=A0AAE1DES9_9GAST|nr:hypothetical protein RRG08_059210 [Elysia crispata]